MMKNFNVENLERKNIYKTPDDFFAKMQDAVVNQTAELKPAKKEGRIVKMNWTYAAAAAVAMIFGVGLFITQDNEGASVSTEQMNVNKISGAATNSLSGDKPITEEAIALKTLEEDLIVINESEEEKHAVVQARPQQVAKAEMAMQEETVTETHIDQIISEIPSSEFAVLANNTENDIYLDLYN